MWSQDNDPFEGRHFQLAETLCDPQPIQRRRRPILIAGSGEQKTLRLVALYGDASNLSGVESIRSSTSSTSCVVTATSRAATTT
jgi:alkanesulfonate monooxygenase SsuD/methylene tetrahydromethanopterin reductase-like flavin-dependent oxidoreductase (luciferase family)